MRRLLRQIVRSNDQNLVIHPCSLVFPNGENHVGYTNPVHVKQALRCKEDFDLLYTCRAFSKSILTSGKNVRLENDWNPSLNVKVPEGFEYPFSFYSQLRHQESLRLNLPESLSTCILTNGEIPSRVLELPNNIQETITTYKAENVFRALNHLFSTKQGPVCLEVGPSTWTELYNEPQQISRPSFNTVLSICSFRLDKQHGNTWQALPKVMPPINLETIIQHGRLRRVYHKEHFTNEGIPFSIRVFLSEGIV